MRGPPWQQERARNTETNQELLQLLSTMAPQWRGQHPPIPSDFGGRMRLLGSRHTVKRNGRDAEEKVFKQVSDCNDSTSAKETPSGFTVRQLWRNSFNKKKCLSKR